MLLGTATVVPAIRTPFQTLTQNGVKCVASATQKESITVVSANNANKRKCLATSLSGNKFAQNAIKPTGQRLHQKRKRQTLIFIQ